MRPGARFLPQAPEFVVNSGAGPILWGKIRPPRPSLRRTGLGRLATHASDPRHDRARAAAAAELHDRLVRQDHEGRADRSRPRGSAPAAGAEGPGPDAGEDL